MTTSTSRRSLLKGAGILTAAAGIIGTVAACAPKDSSSSSSDSGGAAATEAKADGTISAAISYELGTNGYDPMTTSAALTVAVNWHTLEGLTELHPVTREVYAALASEVPSSDGTSVDVALRDGAVFHDGSLVTAEDVVYSFERVLDAKNNSLYAGFVDFIKKVEKKDDATVSFTLAHPVAILAERLSVVKIVPKAAVTKDPKAFDAHPVGSGPYTMTDNGAASKKVVFERFDDYNGPQAAKAKSMTWQIIPDASTRTNAIQSKSAQAIDSVPYLSIDQLKGSATVESPLGFGLLFAMFNNGKDNPFHDLRNRQAFLYAIDMEKVIEDGLAGQAEAASCFVQKDHPDYQEASTVYAQDLDKAKSLFKETGLTSFRLMATDHDWVKQCTPIIQQSLEAAGVTIEFTEKQSADLYTSIDGKPDAYDVVLAPGDPSVFGNDPDLLMRWWFYADVWTDSRMHWKGSEAADKVEDLLEQGMSVTDEDEQKDIWHRTFDLISDQVPLYPLFHRKAPSAWDQSTLVGFEPTALTGLSFVGIGSTK